MMNSTARLPDRLFIRAFILRAIGLWLGLRVLVALLGLPGGTLVVPTGIIASVWIIATTAILCAIEFRRRGEFLLLASLGHSPVLLVVLSTLPVPLLEAMFAALVAS